MSAATDVTQTDRRTERERERERDRERKQKAFQIAYRKRRYLASQKFNQTLGLPPYLKSRLPWLNHHVVGGMAEPWLTMVNHGSAMVYHVIFW